MRWITGIGRAGEAGKVGQQQLELARCCAQQVMRSRAASQQGPPAGQGSGQGRKLWTHQVLIVWMVSVDAVPILKCNRPRERAPGSECQRAGQRDQTQSAGATSRRAASAGQQAVAQQRGASSGAAELRASWRVAGLGRRPRLTAD